MFQTEAARAEEPKKLIICGAPASGKGTQVRASLATGAAARG
jgi:hypothetical protein